MPEENPYNLPPEFKGELQNFYQLASEEDLESDDLAPEEHEAPIYSELKSIEKYYTDKEFHKTGGMKRICKVTDQRTSRPIAMAEMKKKGSFTQEEIEQFLREARITAALEHPNIVPIYDIGLNKFGKPYFTMKFLRDESLNKVIHELYKANPAYTTRYSLNILLDIFLKICDAVAFAHSCGVVHLDIKPDNVMIGSYGEVYICDWGLAKVLDSSREEYAGIAPLDETILNNITLSGEMKGTPGFMAPEQVDWKLGEKNEQTDIYALGCLLYTLLTLKRPFSDLSIKKTLEATIKRLPASPQQVATKEIPASLSAICLKAMAKRQLDRYTSLDEVIGDIRSYQEGFATEAENATTIKSMTLLFKRNILVFTLLPLILILGSVTGVVLYNRIKSREDASNNLLLEKEEELAKLKKRSTEEIKRLKAREKRYIATVNRERQTMYSLLANNLISPGYAFLSHKKSLKSEIDVSYRIASKGRPAGTKGDGLFLVESDILHTGIILPEKFCLAFWLKLPDVLPIIPLTVNTDGGEENEFNLKIYSDGTIKVYIWEDETNSAASPPNYAKPGEWIHLAVISRGKEAGLQLLLNGKIVAETVPNFTVHSWGKLKLKNFGCEIDELRVWNEVKSAEQLSHEAKSLDPDRVGLIGWFNFDEAVITKGLVDELGRIVNNRAASPSRTLPVSAPGFSGRSLFLSERDIFEPNVDLTAAFTLSLWVKTPTVLADNSLKIVTDKGGTAEFNFICNQFGRATVFTNELDGPNKLYSKEGAIVGNKWTHFTMTHRGTNKGIELFINGKHAGWVIGNWSMPWGRLKFSNFDCEIDELRIWNRGLSNKEIMTKWSDTIPDKKDLVGWFKFDQESSTLFENSVNKTSPGKVGKKF